MRVASPAAKLRAYSRGSHLRLNDPEPSLFPACRGSESLSVAVCHAPACEMGPAARVCDNAALRQKFQAPQKIKFRPQFEIFPGFDVVCSRRGEELNRKPRDFFDAHCTSGAID